MSWVAIGTAAVSAGAAYMSSKEQADAVANAAGGMSVNLPNPAISAGGVSAGIQTPEQYAQGGTAPQLIDIASLPTRSSSSFSADPFKKKSRVTHMQNPLTGEWESSGAVTMQIQKENERRRVEAEATGWLRPEALAQMPDRVGIDYGPLAPAQADLVSLIGANTQLANQSPELAQGALGAIGQYFQDPNRNLLNQQIASTTGIGQSAEGALSGLYGSGFQRALQEQAYGGASGALSTAALAGQEQTGRTLDLLRQQAQPFEDRAFQGLQERLFKTGQGGTTGGGLHTEAFARGLGQADLSRQLAAGAEGRAVTQAQLDAASGMAGIGQQTAVTEEDLLRGAFGRFQDTQSLLGGLGQASQQRLQGDVGMQMQAATMVPQLQSAYLSPAITALGAQSGLQTQGLEAFNAALAYSQAEANARIGSGSNLAAISGNPNFGASPGWDALSGIAGGISSAYGSGSGVNWGSLGSGGASQAPIGSSQPGMTTNTGFNTLDNRQDPFNLGY